MLRKISLFLILTISVGLNGQSASDILHDLKKLQNPVRVLYLAAHPDDENTRLISWLANDVGAETAYLSLTRGDGGQNLIGTELGAKLGILRTQELMQARKIDGGNQFFTRAVDFGYSKTADETLKKWGKQNVLSDVVWVIRNFRPHIIITRFPPDERAGHGHHTASAMLGIEAFKLAGKEESFPEQLKYVEPWQPTRIYWNSSNWWNTKLDSLAKASDEYLILDAGSYLPLLGVSSNELASQSRTQHKSQGFGVSIARGEEIEYLKYLDGEKALTSIFDGTPQNWAAEGFKAGDAELARIIKNFNPLKPDASVPALLKLRAKADEISDEKEQVYFKEKLDAIIVACLGVHAEFLTESTQLVKDNATDLSFIVLNRSNTPLKLTRIKIPGGDYDFDVNLDFNKSFNHTVSYTPNIEVSQPYWLKSEFDAIYTVKDQRQIGKPENDPSLWAIFTFDINGQNVDYKVPATYKHSERVEGEIIEPVFIVPSITVRPAQSSLIFATEEPQDLNFDVFFTNEEEITLNLSAPGWSVEPKTITIAPVKGSNRNTFAVNIKPQAGSLTGSLEISRESKSTQSAYFIEYPHIENRLILSPSAVKLNRIDLVKKGIAIGYIPGAGDEVAEAISQMGYEVHILDENALKTEDLSQYRAIVAGIRAYNTQEWLPASKSILMKYIENGGNYIVQYNTASRDLLTNDIGPYPFTLTRNRVTEEDAAVERLLPEHPIFSKPNKLTTEDFDGWVQERGLYFAGNIDEHYQTPIGWHDEGEETQNGGLIIANYGKGTFMYTGISFFRELPAGVPGAYRLLANMLSYKKQTSGQQ